MVLNNKIKDHSLNNQLSSKSSTKLVVCTCLAIFYFGNFPRIASDLCAPDTPSLTYHILAEIEVLAFMYLKLSSFYLEFLDILLLDIGYILSFESSIT